MRTNAVPVNGKRVSVDDKFSILIPFPCNYYTPEKDDALCIYEPKDSSYYGKDYYCVTDEDLETSKSVSFRYVCENNADFDEHGMFERKLKDFASKNIGISIEISTGGRTSSYGRSNSQRYVVCLDTDEVKTGFVTFYVGNKTNYIHLILTRTVMYFGFAFIDAYSDEAKELWLSSLLKSVQVCGNSKIVEPSANVRNESINSHIKNPVKEESDEEKLKKRILEYDRKIYAWREKVKEAEKRIIQSAENDYQKKREENEKSAEAVNKRKEKLENELKTAGLFAFKRKKEINEAIKTAEDEIFEIKKKNDALAEELRVFQLERARKQAEEQLRLENPDIDNSIKEHLFEEYRKVSGKAVDKIRWERTTNYFEFYFGNNAALYNAILSNMENGCGYTIRDMLQTFDCFCENESSTRISSIVQKMCDAGLVKKEIEKRQAYFTKTSDSNEVMLP